MSKLWNGIYKPHRNRRVAYLAIVHDWSLGKIARQYNTSRQNVVFLVGKTCRRIARPLFDRVRSVSGKRNGFKIDEIRKYKREFKIAIQSS